MDKKGSRNEVLFFRIKRLEHSFYACARKLGSEIAESMEETLTPYQYLLLQVLAYRGICTSSQLAKELRVNPGAITAMIDRLDKRNYIVRERNESDRRTINIGITPTGEKVLKNSEAKRTEILGGYLSQMETEEQEKMVILLEKITQIIVSPSRDNSIEAITCAGKKEDFK